MIRAFFTKAKRHLHAVPIYVAMQKVPKRNDMDCDVRQQAGATHVGAVPSSFSNQTMGRRKLWKIYPSKKIPRLASNSPETTVPRSVFE